MIKYVLVGTLLATFSLLPATNANIHEIVKALKSGNASQLESFMDNKLSVTINGQVKLYNQKDAVRAIGDFFQKNPVSNFVLLHQSESSGVQYFIGNLVTTNGTFRTTVYLKSKGDNWVIKEIQFD